MPIFSHKNVYFLSKNLIWTPQFKKEKIKNILLALLLVYDVTGKIYASVKNGVCVWNAQYIKVGKIYSV